MSEELRLAVGGPFHRLERAARIDPLRRLIPTLIAITWVPLMLLAMAEWGIAGDVAPIVTDLSVHARLVIALPLFVVAERLLDRTANVAVARAFDEGYVPAASQERVRHMLGRVARWRDAPLPESLLLVLAVAVGVASLAGLIAPAGAIQGTGMAHHGATRSFYALLALPLFQFLLWRSLFRWVLWVRVLFGLSRVPLRLQPAHADRRAGIGFLKIPSVFFCASMLVATSSVLCAGWATQVRSGSVVLEALRPVFFAYVLIGIVIAFAPLLAFVPQLFQARIVGKKQYGGLVSDYVQRFHERWIVSPDRRDLLGTADLQALADLSTSYQENVEKISVFLFSSRDWIALLIGAFIPAIPLLFLVAPAHDVIRRILGLVLGKPTI
jgi:hypothetical protein